MLVLLLKSKSTWRGAKVANVAVVRNLVVILHRMTETDIQDAR